MTNRSSKRLLAGAVLCLGLFAALAVLVANSWSPLLDLDHWVGRRPELFSHQHDWARQLWIEVGRWLRPDYLVLAGLVAAGVLIWKGHRRAGLWAAGVLLVARVASPLLKELVRRDRPVWPHPVQTLVGYSFPSGHATEAAAAAGVAIAIGTMLVRRRAVRRLLITVAVLLALLIGADRIFLGVHNLSDVVAGGLLGAATVLLGLVVFDPTPHSIARSNEPLPEVLVSKNKLAVVLNPIKVDDVGQFKAMVNAIAAESGIKKVEWYETTVEDTGYGMAEAAAVGGADLVMSVGGDGTIRAVCEELAGTGIPVGIVPAGTGNLLARNLDIPLYLRAAVDVAINGQDRAIDMVKVSGDNMEDATYLVMAGMGFDAAIMEGVNEDIKAKVGWLAYVWSALKSLMFPAIRVEVSIDGADFTRHRARTIVIGNVGNLQGGMPLIPDAAIDDGQLDVVLLYPRRFLSWLPLAVRVLSKNTRSDETITRMTGREVVVRASVDAPRQLDGDLIAPGKELRAECVHGRLLVRVPR
ncbi:MAG: phosphoesterase, PA-phosphatase related protein [Marmoricola sp.]|nr:phosphoesterase, PA-phosphatase related protein [Marmoricola sp.]